MIYRKIYSLGTPPSHPHEPDKDIKLWEPSISLFTVYTLVVNLMRWIGRLLLILAILLPCGLARFLPLKNLTIFSQFYFYYWKLSAHRRVSYFWIFKLNMVFLSFIYILAISRSIWEYNICPIYIGEKKPFIMY